ncbi:MmcQ/YjbR family DNA-binding protein [Campylobacter sp. VBCF_05 NA6]|uniref:MmcQ/YjbR family DNA-binding protein n=1 Tax=unclassified Campylobacter TaxID=2593542 RepID=UPI0022E9EF63|nr:MULTISPECIES: MmcQ/YjbR family DNA-binding protein [unclassified Campylobacter]MDA3057638.1 MmcQ/YjbR family DNA-binding protein [Campylobacter sp. VBCF_04 NA7]MDA3058539.1 MmcQ/YjbR family DNA-binding protein [Campylobacter sp. VBCF_05 NA6]
MEAEALIQEIWRRYCAKPEYLWKSAPNFCVFRHEKNKKWFAVLMKGVSVKTLGVEPSAFMSEKMLDILNLKIEPNLGEILRDGKSVIEAYHMNKKHWISVILGVCDEATTYDLIEESYKLTKK